MSGTTQAVTPVTSTSSQTMSNLTGENKELLEGVHRQAVQPVVVNNQSAVSTNTQSFSPLRTQPRSNNNSFERKQNMVSEW